jgi:8-hydroxy-5-deazaflavin:NADPH oxidoreductase
MTGEEKQFHFDVCIIGGTGKQGKGLAYCLAVAGCNVVIGSRSQEKAIQIANQLSKEIKNNNIIEGAEQKEAAKASKIIILTVPYSAHKETIIQLKDFLKGKLLIDVTVPLIPPQVSIVKMPAAGSAAQEAVELLGSGVEVCTAFQNISADRFFENGQECDVLVTGTSAEARKDTLALVRLAGFQGWDAGPIENSCVVEGLTSVLLGINKNYNSKKAGIKIIGVRASS